MRGSMTTVETPGYGEKTREESPRERIGDDLVQGAKAIADETDDTVSGVYHKARMGQIPVFKIGKLLCMRKSTYRRMIERLEAGE